MPVYGTGQWVSFKSILPITNKKEVYNRFICCRVQLNTHGNSFSALALLDAPMDQRQKNFAANIKRQKRNVSSSSDNVDSSSIETDSAQLILERGKEKENSHEENTHDCDRTLIMCILMKVSKLLKTEFWNW
jgi:hypothetical protein